MKTGKFKLLFILLFIFILSSCSSAKKTENKNFTIPKGMFPKGVICNNDYKCEVEDPFDANINLIKKCFRSHNPEAVKNYDGHSIIIRSVTSVSSDNNIYKSTLIINEYLKILAEVYKEKYNKEAEDFFRTFISYKKEQEKTKNGVIERIFLNAEISNLSIIGQLASLKCRYFNINQFLKRRFYRALPPSFKLNLNSLLDEASKRFNKEINKNKKYYSPYKFDLSTMNSFKQKYHKPSKEKLEKALKSLSMKESPRFYFCGSDYSLKTKFVKCSSKDKIELSFIDFVELTHMKSLESIDLRETKIENISLLAKAENLKRVYIMPSQKNKEEMEVLKLVSPNVKIIIHGETQLKRKNELESKILEARFKIEALEKKKKRTRWKKKKRKYQKSIDEIERRITRAQPELEKLTEFLEIEENRIQTEKNRETRAKQLLLEKELDKYNDTFNELLDKKENNIDNKKLVKEIDKKIQEIKLKVKELEDKIKKLKIK